MPSELTHLSLFTGIGGLDLAAEWAGFRTVGQCEWADYPRAVLEKHWPGLPRWRDIRTLTGESFYEQTGLRTVTVLSGGFPCQPFSTAGKRRGKEDDRYLWPEMLRVIQEIRPSWVIGENVAGIVSMALDTVLSDLESIGYACQAVIIPACAVDAPHRRDRCAILGYAKHDGSSAPEIPGGIAEAGGNKPEGAHKTWKPSGAGVRGNDAAVADTDSNGLQRTGYTSAEGCEQHTVNPAFTESVHVSHSHNQGLSFPGSEPGIETIQPENRIEFGGWWPAEPSVGRVAHGVPARVDRLKCLGNAVVPQWAYPYFRGIAELEGMGL